MLWKWACQDEIGQGNWPGVSSEESAGLKRLKRENAKLRRANAVLRAASAFFASIRWIDLGKPWVSTGHVWSVVSAVLVGLPRHPASCRLQPPARVLGIAEDHVEEVH